MITRESAPVCTDPKRLTENPVLRSTIRHQYSLENSPLRVPLSLASYVSARVHAESCGLGEHHLHPRFRAILPSPCPLSLHQSSFRRAGRGGTSPWRATRAQANPKANTVPAQPAGRSRTIDFRDLAKAAAFEQYLKSHSGRAFASKHFKTPPRRPLHHQSVVDVHGCSLLVLGYALTYRRDGESVGRRLNFFGSTPMTRTYRRNLKSVGTLSNFELHVA